MLESLVHPTMEAFKVSPEEWAEAHPHPAFVVEPFRVGGGKFGTMSTQGAGDGSDRALAWIAKREGANAFGMMITIGRANNNDIVINAQVVSKFHAYVRFDDDGQPTITDAGSTLGTFVGERRLEPRVEKAPLTDGAEVRLGTVKLRYYSPPALHAYLLADDPEA